MGVKRVLIFDWDVHHGNGTQEVFYEDSSVLFIDIHQDNLFPSGSGAASEQGQGKGLKATRNIPLLPGCGDAEYLHAFDTVVKPLVDSFRPELILVSAGFDAHESDPLGGMRLTTQGFASLAKKTLLLAEEHAAGKIALFLEGGYNPYFLAKNVLACLKVLDEGV